MLMTMIMGISAKNHGKNTSCYSRLSSSSNGGGGDNNMRIRKGFVPMMVGQTDEESERIFVPTRLMNHPCIINLLELSANELGYTQPGNLRIQYDVEGFKRMLQTIS